MTRLDEYAADVVRRMPHPPREISPGTVIWHLSAMTETRWVVGLGVILMLPVTIWTAWADVPERELWAKVVALVIMVPATTFIVGNPVIGGIRLARDLASGITLRAQILESEWQPPQAFPPTFGAAAHGLTRGRRRVFHPAGDFEQAFESDSTWARDLTPGTYASLLADPTARRVYFDRGPPTRQRPGAADRVAIDRLINSSGRASHRQPSRAVTSATVASVPQPGRMAVRANPPRIGWISGGLVLLLLISVALGSVMVAASNWGTSPNPVLVTWFSGGRWTIGVNGGLWLFLLLWHTYAQREVAISDDRVHVRRWMEVLTGRAGRRWSLSDVTSAQFFVRGGGAKLLIEARGQQVLISIWFWSTSDAWTLFEAFKRAGVPTEWSIPTS